LSTGPKSDKPKWIVDLASAAYPDLAATLDSKHDGDEEARYQSCTGNVA
jgi:hypothetical protein